MLYERWQQVASQGGREIALADLATGRRWRFAELAHHVEALPRFTEPILHPQGHSAEFVIQVLRGWRSGAVVCPLEAEQKPPAAPLPPASCVHLKITSATTGPARLVAFTAAQLAADADNIVATMGLRPDWPNLAVISMAHSYGFSNLVLPLLLQGIPLIVTPSPLPEAVKQAAAAWPALTLPGVPALWRAWLEAGAIPSCVQLAISAGAPLPAALEQGAFAATGVKIHNFYGSSECGGIAYDRSPVPRCEDAYVGTSMDNVQLSIADDGCLQVDSPAVAETYWPEPSEALCDGSFRTGDLAELRQGMVHLRGRVGDQINVAGRKVLPSVIEQALLRHAGIQECLVFGVPSGDADRADLIVACVVTATPLTVEALRQFLLDRLPAWQVPREWWFVESLSVNQRGKLSRAEWRQRFIEARRR